MHIAGIVYLYDVSQDTTVTSRCVQTILPPKRPQNGIGSFARDRELNTRESAQKSIRLLFDKGLLTYYYLFRTLPFYIRTYPS